MLPKTSDMNKKVIGMWKYETGGIPITDFISLRPKMYSYKINDGTCVKKIKGIPKSCVRDILFDDYYNILFNNHSTSHITSFNTIRSFRHELYTYNVTKICLSNNDDKRVILDDKIHTLPYGHYRL